MHRPVRRQWLAAGGEQELSHFMRMPLLLAPGEGQVGREGPLFAREADCRQFHMAAPRQPLRHRVDSILEWPPSAIEGHS
ncbi:hypothetical protein B7486_06040 [cyanobacterium TDX16]|nr:hypothetical protein B7486_06040 [cyanobacterium TDX16]